MKKWVGGAVSPPPCPPPCGAFVHREGWGGAKKLVGIIVGTKGCYGGSVGLEPAHMGSVASVEEVVIMSRNFSIISILTVFKVFFIV